MSLHQTSQAVALALSLAYAPTVAVKSNQHFRAAFEPLARAVITVDGGGLGSVILRNAAFKNVRRPIWPLDALT